MIIATRDLKIRSETGDIAVPVTILLPEITGCDWICRFNIGWPSQPRQGYAIGIDAVQALLMALQTIGIELHASEPHQAGRLSWFNPGDGYGFPVPGNVRDLLQGGDARFL